MMNDLRNNELAVINLVSAMTKDQRLGMMFEVIINMAERGDVEEIADFVLAQLGQEASVLASKYVSKR